MTARRINTLGHVFMVLIAIFLAAGSGGCNLMKLPLMMIFPDPDKKKVEPEFVFPPESKVAIVISTNMDILFEYEYIRQELSMAITGEFHRNITDVEVLHYDQVIRYQESNVYWATHPISAMGKQLDVDYVLYVSVNSFSTYESGSINLPHGMMDASAMLVDVAASKIESGMAIDDMPWQRAVITVDQDASTGPLFEDQSMLRQLVELKFARKLTQAFYEHVPEEEL